MTYATKEDLIPVAKKYCEKIGVEYLFVSDNADSFGYEDKDGHFVHKYFSTFLEELQTI